MRLRRADEFYVDIEIALSRLFRIFLAACNLSFSVEKSVIFRNHITA